MHRGVHVNRDSIAMQRVGLARIADEVSLSGDLEGSCRGRNRPLSGFGNCSYWHHLQQGDSLTDSIPTQIATHPHARRRRPQQAYDHRLRLYVHDTGDVEAARQLGVPRSSKPVNARLCRRLSSMNRTR